MFEKMSLYQALNRAVNITPKGMAIYYLGRKISYRSFNKRICETACFLYNYENIKKGDVVLIALPNIPDSLILLYALNKIGAIVNMVHPLTPYNQIMSIYEKTHSKMAFLYDYRVYKEVEKYRQFPYPLYICRGEDYLHPIQKRIYSFFINRKVTNALKKRIKGKKAFRYLRDEEMNNFLSSPTVDDNPMSPSVILHSGSTTGDPKIICLSNHNFNATAELSCEILGLSPDYVKGKAMLSALPNFHGFGLCMTMHSPLVNCFGAVLVPRFSTKEVVKAIKGSKNVISMCGVPRIYEELIKSPLFWSCRYLKNIHVCFAGGDTLKKATKKAFNEGMKKIGSNCRLFEGYGLSEATSVIVVNTFKHNKEDSIGYPLRGVDIKIVSSKGEEAANNEIGEIIIKSESNMLGYADNNSLSRRAFKNGYLYSGDLGYLDDDGFLFFTSRKKRVVKVSGVATFPNEVEKLISSIPGVKDVCVVGVEDEVMGHALKAFIVTDYVDKQDFKENVLETCQKYLIKWSVPKYIEFMEKLPKTLLSKTDYRKLEK